MRKYQYISLFIATAGVLSMGLPLVTKAQTAVDTEASVGVSASIDAGQTSDAPKLRDTLRQKIQQNYQAYSDNVRNNEDYRNTIIEKRRLGMASTTNQEGPRPMLLHARIEGETGHSASSTEMRADAREHVQAIRLELFAAMRDRLVTELTHAFDNLKQIRARISTRIDLETKNGKDMGSARTLLATADAKLTAADQAIQALKTYTPGTTATTTIQATSSVNVELDRPRKIGEDAIKAINDARAALGDVINAIAKTLDVTVSHE